jgi:hypothetical protein
MKGLLESGTLKARVRFCARLVRKMDAVYVSKVICDTPPDCMFSEDVLLRDPTSTEQGWSDRDERGPESQADGNQRVAYTVLCK